MRKNYFIILLRQKILLTLKNFVHKKKGTRKKVAFMNVATIYCYPGCLVCVNVPIALLSW